jgi:hypothetical protein
MRGIALIALLAGCSHPTHDNKPLTNAPLSSAASSAPVAAPASTAASSSRFFTAAGAPDPIACKKDDDCTLDTIADSGGCCIQSPAAWPQSHAYNYWLSAHRMSAECKAVKCPPLPAPEPPSGECVARCMSNRCEDICK